MGVCACVGEGCCWELLLSVSRRQRRHRPAVRSTRSHRPQLLSAARLANHHRLRRLRRVPRQRRAPSPARPRRLSIFSAGGRARLAAHSCPPSLPPPAPSAGSARPPPPPPPPRTGRARARSPPHPSPPPPPLPSLPRAPRSGLRLTSSCCWGAGGRRSPAQRRGKKKALAESGARDSEAFVGAMEVKGEEQPPPSTPDFLFLLDKGFFLPCCPGRGVSSRLQCLPGFCVCHLAFHFSPGSEPHRLYPNIGCRRSLSQPKPRPSMPPGVGHPDCEKSPGAQFAGPGEPGARGSAQISRRREIPPSF